MGKILDWLFKNSNERIDLLNQSVMDMQAQMASREECASKRVEELREDIKKLESNHEFIRIQQNDLSILLNRVKEDSAVQQEETRLGIRKTHELIQGLQDRMVDLIASYERDIRIGGSRYNWMTHSISQINDEIVSLYNKPIKHNLTQNQIIKNVIKSKWQMIDRMAQQEDIGDSLICPICEKEFLIAQEDKLESECIFLGGHLVRYRCPHCGVIFGPMKMFRLNDAEFSDEYKVHYSVFSEGDSTEAEIATFNQLHPEREKRYLNFGAGAWSKTIDNLREEGYDVWGYDPYAPSESAFIITDWNVLQEMRFDGIFSHDLMEHLRNPVEELKKMKSILKESGVMVHSTACYNYVYEYTRFHLYFYTGDSVKAICSRVGLSIIDKNENSETMTVNYLFGHGNI